LIETETPSGPNTTALIERWSMDGASDDFTGGFQPSVDIIAIVCERGSEPPEDEPSPPELLMKPAGEEDWRPLLVGMPHDSE
jgi:hypothetical protein